MGNCQAEISHKSLVLALAGDSFGALFSETTLN